jgi:hypothetical protein
MASPSSYDIRRNLIDAPYVEIQVPSPTSTGNAAADFRLGGDRGSSMHGLQSAKSQDSLAIKYRRMKCAVVVMATLMIIASMLLVGVSLAMAEHIDELVRQMNNLGSTPRPPPPPPQSPSQSTTVASGNLRPSNDVRDS